METDYAEHNPNWPKSWSKLGDTWGWFSNSKSGFFHKSCTDAFSANHCICPLFNLQSEKIFLKIATISSPHDVLSQQKKKKKSQSTKYSCSSLAFWSSAWLDRHISSHIKVQWHDAHSRDRGHARVTSQMVDVAGVRLVMVDVAQVILGMVDVAQETMTVRLETCQDWLM